MDATMTAGAVKTKKAKKSYTNTTRPTKRKAQISNHNLKEDFYEENQDFDLADESSSARSNDVYDGVLYDREEPLD